MLKKMHRLICFLLSLVLVSLVGVHAHAADPRASDYLHAYTAYGYDYGGGHISVWYEVMGVETMDEIGALTIRLQEQTPGSSTWTTIETYLHTENPDMLSYVDLFFAGHVDYYGARSGYSYRAYVTIWAGKNGGGDSRVILTPVFTAA